MLGTETAIQKMFRLFGNCRHTPFSEIKCPSFSSDEQLLVETHCQEEFQKEFDHFLQSKLMPIVDREDHLTYLTSVLFKQLSESYSSMDCSRAWLTYWTCHSIALLGERDYLKTKDEIIVDFVNRLKSTNGGYGGGPNQLDHLAATYAAIMALATIGTEKALASIERKKIWSFLMELQCEDGSFRVHVDGEIDIRGAYCALSVAKLLNIPVGAGTSLFEKTADWILSCQTYEGGFGAAPGHEAHGGYTFCAVACLILLDSLHKCNIENLLRWTAYKQMSFEGGFAGRTNKLVDGCYSYWNGAVLPMVQQWFQHRTGNTLDDEHEHLINSEALQKYILTVAQCEHGFRDKPGKSPDPYHTAYCLSGLSIAQHCGSHRNILSGDIQDELLDIDPVYNLVLDAVRDTQMFFSNQSL